jgi:hypothetical protein
MSEDIRKMIDKVRQFNSDTDNLNIKSGVNYIYQQHPELSTIGTQEEYSQYLDTIFPDSQVKDIVYHSTNAKEIEGGELRPSREGVYGSGIYVQTNREFTSNFGSTILSLIINTKSPFDYYKKNGQRNDFFTKILEKWRKTNKFYFAEAAKEEFQDEIKKVGFDSIKTDEPGNNSYYILFEPKQIHILGIKNDIEGFKKFIKN